MAASRLRIQLLVVLCAVAVVPHSALAEVDVTSAGVSSTRSPDGHATGTLRVRVTEADTDLAITPGEPLEGVRISFSSSDLESEGATDQDGVIEFAELPAATFWFRASLEPYFDVEYPNVVIKPGRTTSIDVEMTRPVPMKGPVSVCSLPGPFAARYEKRCEEVAAGAWPRYEEMLQTAREVDWLPRADDHRFEGFRLIWWRSFHERIVIKIEQSPLASPVVAVATLDRLATGGTNELKTTRQRLSDPLELSQLRALAEEVGFWAAPAVVARPGWVCVDGARWVVEGVRDGRYHHVDRHCPEDDSVAKLLGLHLIELSGEQFEHIY